MPQTFAEWAVAALALLLLGGLVFLGALVVRDTVRRKGRWGINLRVPDCPRCGEWLNPARVPRSFRQAICGGCTCPKCGCELDKWGVPVGDAEARPLPSDAQDHAPRDRKPRDECFKRKSDA